MAKAQLFLDVPFAEKDQAKGLGARWDAAMKKWYVPHGVDLHAFKKWWPHTLTASWEALADTPQQTTKQAPKQKTKTAPSPPLDRPLKDDKSTPELSLPWDC